MSAKYTSLTPRHLREFCRCAPELQEIFHQLAAIWPDDFSVYVTSIHRRPDEVMAGESGIHSAGPPYRAIDVRIRNLCRDPEVAQEHADKLAAILNRTWFYDPKRPHLNVCVSKLHGSGAHIHIQCHSRTRRRTDV